MSHFDPEDESKIVRDDLQQMHSIKIAKRIHEGVSGFMGRAFKNFLTGRGGNKVAEKITEASRQTKKKQL